MLTNTLQSHHTRTHTHAHTNLVLARRCGPCRAFTPKLNEAYVAYKSKAGENAEVELVFVSWDNSQESFEKYHKEMSWPAIPFEVIKCVSVTMNADVSICIHPSRVREI